jgi:parvulin-like peptidyl-prolyl isomerase
MINCKNCNKPFQPTFNKGSEQVYCSIKCRQENAQKRMYNRIKDEVIGTMPQPKQQPIINQQPYLNSNELLDLKMEIERMKYEQKLRDIENHYAMMLNKIQSRMDLIESRNNEYDDEPVKEESNEFLKTLSGILPLVIEKIQKQS